MELDRDVILGEMEELMLRMSCTFLPGFESSHHSLSLLS